MPFEITLFCSLSSCLNFHGMGEEGNGVEEDDCQEELRDGGRKGTCDKDSTGPGCKKI